MYGFIALIVGALLSVQSRANGQLAVDVHNSVGAAIISNFVGWAFLWVLLLARKSERAGFKEVLRAIRSHQLRWWELFAGVGGTVFLIMQSSAVPQIGVAIFSISVVGGQTASSLLVDKIGLSTNGKQHITWPRVFAAIMTLIAVTIAVYPDLGKANFKILTIVLCIGAGMIVSIQHALNSRVNQISKRSIVTTWINFLVGTFFLAIALAVDFLRGGSIGPLPHNVWVYIGGPCGLIFIAVASNVVKYLGVLNFVLFVVTGQLVGALLLDWIIPAQKGTLSGYLVIGTVITLGSIAFSRFYQGSSITNK